VYMPTSLLTIAARLLAVGVEVDLCDDNLAQCSLECDVLGVNLVGAPYVGRALELRHRLKERGRKSRFVLGGQVVSGFAPNEIRELFGEDTLNGNDDERLASAVGVDVRAVPLPEMTSLIDAYELLSDEWMSLYLANEFSLFVSQGCKYQCTFCPAQRTKYDNVTGKIQRVNESYRDSAIIEKDLRYLVERAQRLGFDRLRLYLSNLDLFQTPSRLREFMNLVRGVRTSSGGSIIAMRGLSTVASFLQVHRSQPGIIEEAVQAGLQRVGFGVDGATAQVWLATRKPQSGAMPAEAIAVARQKYGLTPETLMVFGHSGIDTDSSLAQAVEFTKAMWDEHGSLPRPHVAKTVVPGNDAWHDPAFRHVVRALLDWPTGFQSLDFTALPSPLTHPERELRELTSKYYLEVCGMPGAVTRYVLPELPDMSSDDVRYVREFNKCRYDI